MNGWQKLRAEQRRLNERLYWNIWSKNKLSESGELFQRRRRAGRQVTRMQVWRFRSQQCYGNKATQMMWLMEIRMCQIHSVYPLDMKSADGQRQEDWWRLLHKCGNVHIMLSLSSYHSCWHTFLWKFCCLIIQSAEETNMDDTWEAESVVQSN